MRKAQILLFLGVWVTILPFLGFPYSWQNILTVLTGIIFIYLSYILYKSYTLKEKKIFDNFSENKNFQKTEKSEKKEEINENHDSDEPTTSKVEETSQI